MNSRGQTYTSASTAKVDHEVFKGLDALLARYLKSAGREIDIQELSRLIARNPIEAGPLRELDEKAGEGDLEERLEILRRSYPAVKRLKDDLKIEASLLPEMFELYIPIARFMARRGQEVREKHQRAAVFGINGAQGSGKTTINEFLQAILSHGLDKNVAGFSIDDVYKTYDQRQEMGRTVHPLFAIRSVAGTHDTELAMETLRGLMVGTSDSRTKIPRFDKRAKGGQGDRVPESEWPVVEGPVDIVIFEGWFIGARPQQQGELETPINKREAEEDADGVWRGSMNRFLAGDYRRIFDLLDDLLVIKVRSMEDVFHNRELQEQHLRRWLEEAKSRGEDTGEMGFMSPEEVVSFISLYERTTRHMLDNLPDEARLTLHIGEHHRIEQVRVNSP